MSPLRAARWRHWRPPVPDLAPPPSTSAAAALDAAWERAWARPDRRPIHEWAKDHLYLDGDYHPKGRLDVSTSRYLIRGFELLGNDGVRMLNLLKAVQTGGSLLADTFFQYCLAERQAPAMLTYQTDDDGEQHSVTRLEPTQRASPRLAPLHAAMRKKRDLYQYPGMNVYIQGANMNSLQRKSVCWEINDEVWDWAPNMLAEAWARTESYATVCKIINISQGGDEGTDWELTYNRGRRHDWGVCCTRCGRLQPYEFFATMHDDPTVRAGIVYDDHRFRGGRHDVTACAASARFRCCYCGHDHANDARTWSAFNDSGDYLCLDPDRPLKESSLRWNSLVNGRYDDLVAEFLRASEVKSQGNIAPLRQFYQKKLARFWALSTADESITLSTSEYLMERPFAPGYVAKKLDGEVRRFLTADFQEGEGNDTRHFKVVCRAWFPGGRSRLLWQGRIDGPERLHQLAEALGFRAGSGISVPAAVGVDANHDTPTITGLCARYGWTAFIGDRALAFPHRTPQGRIMRPYSEPIAHDPLRGKVGQGTRKCRLYRWSNQAIKPITWALLHGKGAPWELPADVSQAYRDEVDGFGLKRMLDRRSGSPEWQWVDFAKKHDYADGEHMQVVCALISALLDWDTDAAAGGSAASTPAASSLEVPTAAAAPVAPPPRARKPAELVAPHQQPAQLALF